MDARIGPSGREDGAARPAKLAKGCFHHSLHGAGLPLALKAAELGAVVGEYHLVTCDARVGHCVFPGES